MNYVFRRQFPWHLMLVLPLIAAVSSCFCSCAFKIFAASLWTMDRSCFAIFFLSDFCATPFSPSTPTLHSTHSFAMWTLLSEWIPRIFTSLARTQSQSCHHLFFSSLLFNIVIHVSIEKMRFRLNYITVYFISQIHWKTVIARPWTSQFPVTKLIKKEWSC